jgi:hypothetical protein
MAGNHRSGRKRKPDALRVLQGGKPARPSVICTPCAPPVPEMVAADSVALRYWQHYEAQLLPLGVLTVEHGEALATLACVSADYERARKQFAQTNYQAFVTEKRGDRAHIVETPILRRLEHLAQLKTRLLGEFGLTPVMATKVIRHAAPKSLSKWERLTQRP